MPRTSAPPPSSHDPDRYRFELAKVAVDYYATGRLAVKIGAGHVCANILHHAVELLLKAALIKSGTPIDDLKRKYKHDLVELWKAVAASGPSIHDSTIAELHRFEDIRYPDEYLRAGMTYEIGWGVTKGSGARQYSLAVDDIDRLVVALFDRASLNLKAFRPVSSQALEAIVEGNPEAARWQE